MLKERLQILVTPEQRRRLQAEAERRGTSVGGLVREAIDERYGAVTSEDRHRALEVIRGLEGGFLSPDELDRLVDEERDAVIRPGRR